MYYARTVFYYLPNSGRKRGYYKVVHYTNETYLLIDLWNICRKWKFDFEGTSSIESPSNLLGKAAFINYKLVVVLEGNQENLSLLLG